MASLTQSEVRNQTADEAVENIEVTRDYFPADGDALREYAHRVAVEAVRLIQQQTADQLDVLANALHAANNGGTNGSPSKLRAAARTALDATDLALGTIRA